MFFQGSRYLTVKDYTVTGKDGRSVKLKRTRSLRATQSSFVYQVKQGDRLDLLAQKFYRTPRKWWLIVDANPGFVDPVDLLVPGSKF